jgi:NAD(P)-dependent dehydrogenase (short-subunit alcohol dehydrogenase family)
MVVSRQPVIVTGAWSGAGFDSAADLFVAGSGATTVLVADSPASEAATEARGCGTKSAGELLVVVTSRVCLAFSMTAFGT